MAPLPHRARYALAALTVSLGLAIPATASAGTLPAAPATAYNTTPDCPVSLSDPVCGWNVPVDTANLFTSLDYGECPYWAAEKYPALVLDELASDPLGDDWDGGTWLEHAQQEGLATSSTPASGDLAVWQVEAGDPNGHVAYVEAVLSDGIIVSQMDGESAAPFPSMQGSTEFISTENLAYFATAYGLQFVVTGDPSTTPLSDLLQASNATAPATSPPSSTSVAPAKVKPTRAKTARTRKAKTARTKTARSKTARTKAATTKAAKAKTAAAKTARTRTARTTV